MFVYQSLSHILPLNLEDRAGATVIALLSTLRAGPTRASNLLQFCGLVLYKFRKARRCSLP